MRKRTVMSAKRLLHAVNADLNAAVARGDPPRTILIGGPTGVGKSTFGRDIGQILGCPVIVEDLSIKVPGDMGIPRIDEESGRHHFTLPPWWPAPGITCEDQLAQYGRTAEVPEYLKAANKGLKWPVGKIGLIVILEELCRANEAVLAGAMNMLLDHMLNYNVAPKWVAFMATTNWAEDGYTGRDLDRAQEERMVIADMKPSVAEWAKFCEAERGAASPTPVLGVPRESGGPGRCSPGVVQLFRDNEQYLRLTDDPDRPSEQDTRVPLRTATRVAETLHFMPMKALNDCGADVVSMYLADRTLATQCVAAVKAEREGKTLARPVTAGKLLAGDEECWTQFEQAVKDKDIALVTTVIDEFAGALSDCDGDTIPATADRVLDVLDDEQVRALASKLVHAKRDDEALRARADSWERLLERVKSSVE